MKRTALFFTIMILPITFARSSMAVDGWSGNLTAKYPLGMELSKKDACQKAHLKAKLNAMTNSRCEKVTQHKYRSCKSANEKTKCEFFSETFNSFSGCFIENYTPVKEDPNAQDPELGDVCEVTANVSVQEFRSKHDPSFLISVDESMETIFKDRQAYHLPVRTHQRAFVYILGWFPETDDGYYYTIFPIDPSSATAFDGVVEIPEIQAQFPEDYPKNEVSEFMLVLATKTKLNMKPKESISEFYSRLDEYGREKWRIARIGYRIIR